MKDMVEIKFTVNSKKSVISVDPGEMLSDVLRYRLGLFGTKIGCNEAECGACTVVIDGQAVLSCNYPAVKANGKHIVTIEGLAEESMNGETKLHPLQHAFIEHGAVQCGFCIPGQIMTSFALLQQNPTPQVPEIKEALKDTLCRCAGYPSIISAIQAASEQMQGGQDLYIPQIPEARDAGKMVGTVHNRPDAVQKVTGKAIYSDDIQFSGMAHARVKRAMVPAAIVEAIDISKALAIPGVLAVLTAADLPFEKNHGLVIKDWPVMVPVGGKVRYVGDALAIVAAETREIASEALLAIEVKLCRIDAVVDPVSAHKENAPEVHAGGNLLDHIKVRKGDVDEGFQISDVVLENTFFTNPNDHAFLEPECSIARLTPEGRIEIYVGSQIPYEDREQVARVLGVPDERVRIIGQLIGGGFGGKEDIAGQIHAALLAQVTGRPVKLLFDRQESLIVHPKRHATQITVKLGSDLEGNLLAAQTTLYGDTGAYASLGEKVMTRATTHSSGPYEIENVRADCYAMYTNNPPAGAFRGFGVLQSAFAVESMMDTLAQKLEMDPIALRKKNVLKVGSMTNTGQYLKESVGLSECIQKVESALMQVAGENPFLPREDMDHPEMVRAWGFAVAYKNTGLGGGAPDKAGAEIELLTNGIFEVRSASAELGQGLPTVLQLTAAEELNQGVENVRVLLSDTDLTPDGGPTTASRQTYVTGNAVRFAAKALRQSLVSELSECYDISPEKIVFGEGNVEIGSESLPLADISRKLREEGIIPKVLYTYEAPETKPLGQGGDMHVAFSFAAQAAEVEVNRATGEVSVLHVIAANDVGFAINPLGLKGQVEGGIMMGIGHTLTENFILDQGEVVTDRLASYRIPSITYTPEITSFIVEHPTSDGPFGAKGVGEIVLIPTIPAITNAVYNAVGVRTTSLPIDQEIVLKEIREQKIFV